MDSFNWLPDPDPLDLAIFRAKPPSTVASWAQGERFVHASPLPGTWDNDTMPHLTRIMETFSLPYVREV